MNKHLKPGVAVDVRGASDEDVKAVIYACVELGADRSLAHGVPVGDFVIWDDDNDAWICHDDSEERPVISINQALGRESEVENTWFDRGELPPVGAECEITHDGHKGYWRKVEILKYCLDTDGDPEDQRMIVVDLSGYADFVIGNPGIVYGIKDHDFNFRPLKSEKEKFVERLLKDWESTGVPIVDFIADEYDKGLRFIDAKE